jgi:hypothetical protein
LFATSVDFNEHAFRLVWEGIKNNLLLFGKKTRGTASKETELIKAIELYVDILRYIKIPASLLKDIRPIKLVSIYRRLFPLVMDLQYRSIFTETTMRDLARGIVDKTNEIRVGEANYRHIIEFAFSMVQCVAAIQETWGFHAYEIASTRLKPLIPTMNDATHAIMLFRIQQQDAVFNKVATDAAIPKSAVLATISTVLTSVLVFGLAAGTVATAYQAGYQSDDIKSTGEQVVGAAEGLAETTINSLNGAKGYISEGVGFLVDYFKSPS